MRSKLEQASVGGYLEVFVVGIINNIWGVIADSTRPRQKEKENSALYRLSDNGEEWRGHKIAEFDDHKKERVLIQKAVSELEKKLNSKQQEEREAAKVLWSVCQSNIHTVSKERDESFYQVKRRITPLLKNIKNKLDE
jgi:hypothetical protein